MDDRSTDPAGDPVDSAEGRNRDTGRRATAALDGRRDRVVSALRRGKEQRAHYERTDVDGVAVLGTVAVIQRGERFVVGWHEMRDDDRWAADWEWSGEEESEFADLDAVNAYLGATFGLDLGDLGPAKGTRFFR